MSEVLLPPPFGRCRQVAPRRHTEQFSLWPLQDRAGLLLALKVSTQEARERLAQSAQLQRRARGPCAMPVLFAWRHGERLCWLEPWAHRALSTVMDAERRRGRQAPPSVQLSRLGRLLAATERCHAAGVCHRDIKPDNALFLSPAPAVEALMLADFGLATTVRAKLTDGAGTLAYQAPEVARGAPHTAAADVFSLGATAVEMMVGMAPYEGDDERHTLALLAGGRPAVGPAELAWVLARAPFAEPALCRETAAWAFRLCAPAAADRPLPARALAELRGLESRWRVREPHR